MIARQGDQQEACQIRPDQPLKPVGGREAIIGVEARAIRDQQGGPSGNDAIVSCRAHAINIASTARPLHP